MPCSTMASLVFLPMLASLLKLTLPRNGAKCSTEFGLVRISQSYSSPSTSSSKDSSSVLITGACSMVKISDSALPILLWVTITSGLERFIDSVNDILGPDAFHLIRYKVAKRFRIFMGFSDEVLLTAIFRHDEAGQIQLAIFIFCMSANRHLAAAVHTLQKCPLGICTCRIFLGMDLLQHFNEFPVIGAALYTECTLGDCRNESFRIQIFSHDIIRPSHAFQPRGSKNDCIIFTGFHLFDAGVDVSTHPFDFDIIPHRQQLCAAAETARPHHTACGKIFECHLVIGKEGISHIFTLRHTRDCKPF